jgi:hypothetical protein
MRVLGDLPSDLARSRVMAYVTARVNQNLPKPPGASVRAGKIEDWDV